MVTAPRGASELFDDVVTLLNLDLHTTDMKQENKLAIKCDSEDLW